jgi:hypothetical protein
MKSQSGQGRRCEWNGWEKKQRPGHERKSAMCNGRDDHPEQDQQEYTSQQNREPARQAPHLERRIDHGHPPQGPASTGRGYQATSRARGRRWVKC